METELTKFVNGDIHAGCSLIRVRVIVGPREVEEFVCAENHQALRLASGRVLVVGGGRSAPVGVGAGVDVESSALLFDPARRFLAARGNVTRSAQSSGTTKQAVDGVRYRVLALRVLHTRRLLDGGQVLVCGGIFEETLRSCEFVAL